MAGLLPRVIVRFIISLGILGAVIIIPAGTIFFWNAWLYLGTMLLLMTCALVYLYRHDPELLEKRMNIREKEPEQKRYVKLSIILCLVAFSVPGVDFRFKWSHVPDWLVIISLFIMILSYIMFLIVMMQNTYASRVIEIQEGQKLIDTGMYSVVRHPMYLSAVILYTSSVLVLGSYYALIPVAFLPFLLAFRIRNEEKVLIHGLKGYKEYMQKVKYRLVPYVW